MSVSKKWLTKWHPAIVSIGFSDSDRMVAQDGLNSSTAVRRNGMALLVVLVLIMMVSLSAYGFAWMMQNQYQLARIHEDQVQARLAALSGVEWVAAILEQPALQRSELGELLENPSLFQDISVEPELPDSSREAEFPLWRFSVLSPRTEELSSSNSNIEGSARQSNGLEGVVFGLQSESAKIHLPTLAEWDRLQPGHARQVLSSLPGATREGVNAWLNGLGQQSSSQTGHQQRLRLWFGEDLNHNYRLDPIEISLRSTVLNEASSVTSQNDRTSVMEQTTTGEASGSAAHDLLQGWQQFLTWHSGQRNENMNGRPRIFLNTPDLSQLHRQLIEIWPVEWANYVIAYRQYGTASQSDAASRSSTRASSASSAPRASSAPPTTPDLPVGEPDFSVPAALVIESALELIGTSVRVPSASSESDGKASDQTFPSPFRDEIVSASDYLSKLLDDVTVKAGSRIEGRIDVSQACLPVLLAVPGMQKELADRILQHRLGPEPTNQAYGDTSSQASARLTIAWLFEEGLVDLPQLIQLEPYLTARSDVYSCQIVGYKDNKHAMYRTTLTVDARSRQSVVRDFRTWHDWDRGFDVSSLQSATNPPVR